MRLKASAYNTAELMISGQEDPVFSIVCFVSFLVLTYPYKPQMTGTTSNDKGNRWLSTILAVDLAIRRLKPVSGYNLLLLKGNKKTIYCRFFACNNIYSNN